MATHTGEAPGGSLLARRSGLRAGVLGATDGIVSVAGLVVGVAGAGADRPAIALAGVAGLVAGALSMAGGEYVSVSTQRDTERATLDLERWELATMPEAELGELAAIYQSKGLSPELAHRVAVELTAHDALAAHAEAELGIDPNALSSPTQAALASFASFVAGALLPLAAILVPPSGWRLAACAAAVVAALVLTGWVSARLGGAAVPRAVLRNVVMGTTGMLVTYLVGRLVGAQL